MPTPLEWTTLVLGAAGTTLGIVNGVRQIVSARVRLRIRSYPLHQIAPPSETFACVEIANVGSFPVTIKEVAFKLISYPGQTINFGKRCSDGIRLPKRLEPHDAIQVCFPYEGMPELIAQSEYIVVETACGEIRRGKLDYWRRMARVEAKGKRGASDGVVI